jgi:hypothetical protein
MAFCGVTNCQQVIQYSPVILNYNWLEPRLLVNLLALKRFLPKECSKEQERSSEGWMAAVVIEQFASYVVGPAPERLVGRLLWLEQLGVAHLVVRDKKAARQAWREQQSLPAHEPALGQPMFISVRDITRPDAAFIRLPAVSTSGRAVAHTADSLAAFLAGLEQHPAWQQLMSDAERLSSELADKLLAELRPSPATKQSYGRWRSEAVKAIASN